MTRTPWGNADELRLRRLPPGPGTSREEVTTNQRERLMAAMVAAVEEHGYEATRVADLVALSGVSRSTFYGHFKNKAACLLATFDAIAAAAGERIAAAYGDAGPGEDRLRAAFDAFLELVTDQPAAARLCLVEAYAAGPAGLARIERVTAAVDRAVAGAFDESPERAGMPRDMVRAIVGGIVKAVHTRLRRREEGELERLLPELLDWALSYRTPPQPLRRPRRRPDRGAAARPVAVEPADRLVAAITATVADRGYPSTTIAEIADRASASLSTFYAQFPGKQEAFLAALERASRDTIAVAAAAYQQTPDWPQAARDGLDALFGFLAAEPAVASLGVEAYAAGPRALEHGDATIQAFHRFLEPGYDRLAQPGEPISEAIGGAVLTLTHGHVRQHRAERMRDLTPLATYLTLAPFVGATAACAVANEPLRPH